jgi:endonuclease/exonuclease/phosphatase family metal-dependent hydrolase
MERVVRLFTYNIHHGKGVDGKVRLRRVAAVLQRHNPDAVALQEVDRHLPRSYLRHQARALARHLGMYFVFTPTLSWLGICQYGLAILSRYPISEHQYYPLPGAHEPRGLQSASLDHDAGTFFLLNTHLGLNYQEREKQAEAIREIIRSLSGPVVLAGDMNTERLTFPELPVTPPDHLPTFPSYRPRFGLDRIFASRHWRIIRAFTPSTGASDHLPLLVELVPAN